ncbi:unnamed protein product [Pleuronectes platessa]|uniref:Uncharacterized protein n=1 Tax=Pleuronectes platessa TaxID=8262 RepID=A0A9N7VN59_PLEPL|nr:unnamed protein product [Pleuronectes platessa]
MHGGMAATRSPLTGTEAAGWGRDQRLCGATGEDGRKSRSDAEGKIETDFLAARRPHSPGLPSPHPQRGPLRQIGEDYDLSQGPRWEHREALSSAGWKASTHPLRRITAGWAERERKAACLAAEGRGSEECRPDYKACVTEENLHIHVKNTLTPSRPNQALASLPNRDFRLRGFNTNFDVDSVLESEVKGKREEGRTMA